MQPVFLKISSSTLNLFPFCGLIFVQIRQINQTVALLQEVYRKSMKDLSPLDIITYIEILAESTPLLGYMNGTNPDKDIFSNSTLVVC